MRNTKRVFKPYSRSCFGLCRAKVSENNEAKFCVLHGSTSCAGIAHRIVQQVTVPMKPSR